MFTAEKPVKGSPTSGAKKPAKNPRTAEDTRDTPPEKPRSPEETRDWLTRNEAVDLLSCALQTLVNYERKGALKPAYAYRPDGRGVEHRVLVYSPHELKKLAVRMNRAAGGISPRNPGEVTARAFELIEEGRSGREIIRELRLTVEDVRELREKWNDEGGAALIISPAAKEALEKIVGAFEDVAELVERTGVGLFIAPSEKETLAQIVGAFESIDELIGRVAQRSKPA